MDLENMKIKEVWASVQIEVHYREGAPPLTWTPEERASLLEVLGLHPRGWVLYPRPPVRDSTGSLVQHLWADSHAGEEGE